jgi:hypothetical protein
MYVEAPPQLSDKILPYRWGLSGPRRESDVGTNIAEIEQCSNEGLNHGEDLE